MTLYQIQTLCTRTYGDADVECHVVDGGEVLLVVHIPWGVRKDVNFGIIRERFSQIARPLQTIDER